MRVRMSALELEDAFGDDIWEEMQERAVPAVVEAADVIVAAAKLNLSRDRGGEAAPGGEAPGRITGDLQSSIELLGKARQSKYSISQSYGSKHPGAGLHEFGGTVTQSGVTRIYPPRPYIRPAEDQTADEVEQILEDL